MQAARAHGQVSEAKIRVVLVDDEADVRLLVRTQLETRGFEIVGEAAEGAEAIERCRAIAPDAVVLDLLMPGLSGFETIPPLREILPELVIVAYTGVAGEFVRKEMLRLDVPFVLKSSDGAALVDKLRELVRSA